MDTILLIDDNAYILQNLKEYLEMEGYNILIANNGEQGIKCANNYMPDLIVCDVSIHEKNGYEVLHSLKVSPKTSKIPFIFSTSMIEKLDVSGVFKLGAVDYILKPFEPKALLKMIKTHLENRGRELYHESYIS